MVLPARLSGQKKNDEDKSRATSRLVVDGAVEDVWHAFSTTEGLRSWIAPLAEIDLRVGGKMRTNDNPNGKLGDTSTIESTILSLDPGRMISLKATKFPKGFPFVEVAKKTWSVFYFEAIESGSDAGKTRLTIVGLGYTDEPKSQQMRKFFEVGNKQSVRGLERALRRRAQGYDLSTLKRVLQNGAGEGPAWHPELGVLFSGHGGINRIAKSELSKNEDRKVSAYREKAGTNGLLFDAKGRLLACEPKYRRVTRTELDGSITVLTDRYEGKRYNTPNDLAVDSKGRIYFSDPRYGSRDNMEIEDGDGDGGKVEGVYRIDLDGSVHRIITHEADRPNGLGLTDDDRHLFVADNNNNDVGGARQLWRFDLREDGTIDAKSKHLVFDWEDSRGPDGMAFDSAGRIFVAGGLNRDDRKAETNKHRGGVYVFSPTGKHLGFIPVPKDEVTNCAFGGEDLRTLFITAGGELWSIRTSAPGRPVWPKLE